MTGGKRRARRSPDLQHSAYAERLIARARELHEDDAFAPPEVRRGNAVSAAAAKAELAEGDRRSRHMVAAFAVVALAVAAFSLLLPYRGFDTMGSGGTIYAPKDVLDCYALWFQMHVLPLFDTSLSGHAAKMLADFNDAHPDVTYSFVMRRALATFIVVVCGLMLAVCGLLFQTAFRNPLAAPTSLGVSDGVTLGCVIFAMLGNDAIGDSPVLYLVLVYGLGAASVVAVLLLSRAISGGRTYNVLDMLLIGTVLCQLLGGCSGYVQNFIMDYTQWYNFYDVQQANDALQSDLVCAVVLVVAAITIVPALVLRFRFNLISFPDEEGRMMGVRANLLRMGALGIGSVMELAAIASIGQVAILSLAVPFLVRYMMPADFRSQLLGNALVGATVLLICFVLQHFATLGIISMPVGTIVSVFIVPFFVWMVAFGHGRW